MAGGQFDGWRRAIYSPAMASAIWIPNYINLLTDAVEATLAKTTGDSECARHFAAFAMSKTHSGEKFRVASAECRVEDKSPKASSSLDTRHSELATSVLPHPTSPGVPGEEPESRLTITFLRRDLLPAYALSQVEERPTDRQIRTPETNSASLGMAWSCSAWNTLAGGLRDSEPIERLILSQTTAGHFLNPTANDNLESWWYSELILLHAMGTFAAITRSAQAFTTVHKAATYHLNETQPDHATNEPWAIFPFLLQAETRSLADQLLHNARMMPATATSLMLLADALYCVKSLTNEGPQP